MGPRVSGRGRLGSSSALRTVALDTNSCIYYLAKERRRGKFVHALVQRAQRGELRVHLSPIVRMELLVQPLKTKDALEMRRVIALTRRTQGVVVFSMTEDMVAVGAELRARTGMKLPDALVAATAALTNCEVLVGNDAQFKRMEMVGDSFRSELTGLRIRVPAYIHLDEVVHGA